MKPLRLGDFYDRQAVHDIFDPYSKFTKQAGTWGLQGIISLRYGKPFKTSKDYVFFVTFGQSQGHHKFEEGITKDGILTWQSQPKQSIVDATIQDFIHHDVLKNSIHLFLRTNKKLPYQYLGRLGYHWHDPESNRPVHFLWQLIDWNEELIAKIDFPLLASLTDSDKPKSSRLSQSNKQVRQSSSWQFRDEDWTNVYFVNKQRPQASTESSLSASKSLPEITQIKSRNINFAEQNERHSRLGEKGELIVLKHERERLNKANRQDLSEKVYRTCERSGNTTPFDIFSYETDGTPRLIEVKTTQYGELSPFYLSAQEYEFAEQNMTQYWLYRIYDLDFESMSASFFVLSGKETLELEKEPVQYLFKI